eukprot:451230-Alexandrium_andersonii.AAC.1
MTAREALKASTLANRACGMSTVTLLWPFHGTHASEHIDAQPGSSRQGLKVQGSCRALEWACKDLAC